MRNSKQVLNPSMIEKQCNSAKEFLGYLRPEHDMWKVSPISNWIFRGQRDAIWHLEPKAFRKKPPTCLSYTNFAFEGPFEDVKDQCRHEFYLIHDFLLHSDDIGLSIPGDHLMYRTVKGLLTEVYESFDEFYWPPDKLLEPLALGQHHGVPTRLIDFSGNPLVAAFFASYFAFYFTHEKDEEFKKNPDKRLCIWGLNLVRLKEISNKQAPRIYDVRVPLAPNVYLQRQRGLFLYDTHINKFWNKGNPPYLDEVILDLHKEAPKDASTQPIFIKLSLPIYPCALELLQLLEQEDMTLSYLMPTFDNVVRHLEFYRSLDNQPYKPPLRIL